MLNKVYNLTFIGGRMKNELIAINTLTDTININIKSIYKTRADFGDVYQCKMQGDVYYCYVIVIKGKITLQSLHSYQFDLAEGQAVFLWSNEIKSYSCSEETQYLWVYFSITETDLLLMKPFSVANMEKALNNFHHCISLLNRSTIFDLCRANMIFTKYVLEGIEKLQAEEVNLKGWHRATIEMSVDYIKDNLYHLPTIQELATHAGMSLKQYRKHFKKMMGEYPAKYICEQKLLVVKDYLVNTDLSINQIADMFWFSSSYYLSTSFKKKYGCTPSEYRKRFRK